MLFSGVLIGFFSFVLIGLFHPIVVTFEYHFSWRVWPVFLAAGLLFLAVSLLTDNTTASALFGAAGFSCLWSIRELREQAKRVRKGWYPANPDREKQS